MSRIVLLMIALCGILVLVFNLGHKKPVQMETEVEGGNEAKRGNEVAVEKEVLRPPEEHAPVERFECKGKTRCHEMESCEEALFYLSHCPNVEIDGDRDGKPCEDRCGH